MTKNAASNASSWIAAVSIRYECRCASTINADTTVSFDVVLNSVREFWYSMYDNMRFLESSTWNSGIWKTAFCWAIMSSSRLDDLVIKSMVNQRNLNKDFELENINHFEFILWIRCIFLWIFASFKIEVRRVIYLERHKGLIHGDQVGPSFEVKSIPFVDRYSGLVNNWVW